MSNKLMMGLWRYILPIPTFLWKKQIAKMGQKMETEFSFMSEEHYVVHHCAVRELPRVGEPLSPEVIAEKANLPLARVTTLLDELEKHMILVRNNKEAVVWAYPVTVEATPHHVTFSTGEQLYAA
jgi:hypothetical protein